MLNIFMFLVINDIKNKKVGINFRNHSKLSRKERHVLGNQNAFECSDQFQQKSVPAANKGDPAHPNTRSRRERATTRSKIRCSWSTSCLTEQHKIVATCVYDTGGQRVEQPDGRRRIINHGLGRPQRVLFRGVLDEVYFRKRKNGKTRAEGDVPRTFAKANCRWRED